MSTKSTTDAAPAAAMTTNTGDFGASGAPRVELHVDTSHPALDADPRSNTTAKQNQIDLNDPTKSGSEAVTEALKAK